MAYKIIELRRSGITSIRSAIQGNVVIVTNKRMTKLSCE